MKSPLALEKRVTFDYSTLVVATLYWLRGLIIRWYLILHIEISTDYFNEYVALAPLILTLFINHQCHFTNSKTKLTNFGFINYRIFIN